MFCCFMVSSAFGETDATYKGLAAIGAGFAVIGAGIGIGNIFSSFIEAVGRNPGARGEVFTMTMLGFALVEAIALFALVIALVILFG